MCCPRGTTPRRPPISTSWTRAYGPVRSVVTPWGGHRRRGGRQDAGRGVRDARVLPRRGRLPGPLPGLAGGVRGGRRRVLRREGVPVPRRGALAERGGAQPRRVLRRGAGHRAGRRDAGR